MWGSVFWHKLADVSVESAALWFTVDDVGSIYCQTYGLWSLLHSTTVVPGIVKWLLDFWKIGAILTTTTTTTTTTNFFFHWHYKTLWVCIFQPSSGVIAFSRARFLDHTQRRAAVGRTPLDEWSVRRRDLYLTTHTTLTTDKHPYPRWDSNPRSQQASGRRPTL